MSVVLIRCDGCFKRYPVNPNKHKDRDTRYCPFCGTPRKIRARFGKFLPNPKWPQQKLKQAADRVWSKEMRKSKRQTQPIIPVQIPENLLALSLLFRKREMELKKQQGKTK